MSQNLFRIFAFTGVICAAVFCMAQTEPVPVLQEEPPFIFTPRGRRNPFIPPFGTAASGPSITATGKPEGTREEMMEAARVVRDLEQALRDGNFPRFKIFYERVMKLMTGRNWTDKELMVHSREILRRASRLKNQMDMREKVALYNNLLDAAEALIPTMEEKLAARDYDGVTATYAKVVDYISRVKKDSAYGSIVDRLNKIHKRASDIFRRCGQQKILEVLGKAETILDEMRRYLQAGNFDRVLERYEKLRIELAVPLPPGHEELARSKQRLLAKAGEIKKQAEIGKVKRVISNVKGMLKEMENALYANNYARLISLYNEAQQRLRQIQTSEAPLVQARNEVWKKAEELKRRADIRREFVFPRIDGIAWAPVNPGALVNGRAVGEGDAIDENTRVKKINRDNVIFTYKGEDIPVALGAGKTTE